MRVYNERKSLVGALQKCNKNVSYCDSYFDNFLYNISKKLHVIERRDGMEWIHELFQQYGYYVVLVGLLLEYIALPFPGEPTLAYAGFLAHKGDLSLPILIILSFIGTSVGMTIQYF